MKTPKMAWVLALMCTWVAGAVVVTLHDATGKARGNGAVALEGGEDRETSVKAGGGDGARPETASAGARADWLPAGCAGVQDNDCIKAALVRAVEEDIERGMKLAEQALAENEVLRAGCHSVSHGLGRASAKAHGMVALRYAKYGCQRGYLHGVVQQIAKQYREPRELIKGVSEACIEYFDNDTVMLQDCLHATGQSAVYVSPGDLRPGLDACMTLPMRSRNVTCASGLLMDYGDGALHAAGFTSDPTAEVFAEPYPGNIVELCRKYQDTNLTLACFRRLWMFEAPKWKDRPEDLDEMCASARNEDESHACYTGMGDWAHRRYWQDSGIDWPPGSKAEADRVAKVTAALCSKLKDELTCTLGLVNSVAGHMYGYFEDEVIPEYCQYISKNLYQDCVKGRDAIIERDLAQLG